MPNLIVHSLNNSNKFIDQAETEAALLNVSKEKYIDYVNENGFCFGVTRYNNVTNNGTDFNWFLDSLNNKNFSYPSIINPDITEELRLCRNPVETPSFDFIQNIKDHHPAFLVGLGFGAMITLVGMSCVVAYYRKLTIKIHNNDESDEIEVSRLTQTVGANDSDEEIVLY